MKISTKISQVPPPPACDSDSTSFYTKMQVGASAQWRPLVFCHPRLRLQRKISDQHQAHWPYHQVYSSQPLLKAQHAPILKGEQKTQPAQQNTRPLVHWAGFQGLRICISCHFLGYTGPAILHQKNALKEFQGQMRRRKKSKKGSIYFSLKGRSCSESQLTETYAAS